MNSIIHEQQQKHLRPANSIQQARLDEACQKVFKEYPEIVMAAGEGANVSFRFLADNVVSELGEDTIELEDLYGTLYALTALAKAGYAADDPDAQKYRHVATTAFRLGLECGKNVHGVLKQRDKESPKPHYIENWNGDVSILPKVEVGGVMYPVLPVPVGSAPPPKPVPGQPIGDPVVDTYIKATMAREAIAGV